MSKLKTCMILIIPEYPGLSMIIKNHTITAADGMHAQPATNLVKLTKNYSLLISKKGRPYR